MTYIREPDKTMMQDKRQLWKHVLLCGLLFALIAFSGIRSIFIYLVAIATACIFVFLNEKECVLFLVFLSPFSLVLKLSVGTMSFFSIYIFIVLLRVLLSVRSFDKEFLVPLLIFLAYCIVFSGVSQIKTIITIGAWLFLVYNINKINIDGEGIVWAYCSGMCLSSILGLLREKLPLINRFLYIEQLKLAEETYAERFAGLEPNPNYLGLDLSVALSCLVVLILLRKPKLIDWLFILGLLIFGFMTVSQSFLVGLALLMLLWLYYSFRRDIGKSMKIIIALVILGTLIYFLGQEYINLFLFRFSQKEGGSLSKITTGRTDIWFEYIQAIFSSPKTLLFGNGFNSVVESGHGAHNTYLELFHALGLCGCSLYIFLIFISVRNIFSLGILRIPIIILLIRLFAIGIATWDNFWIYFILFICIANDDWQKEGNEIETQVECKYIRKPHRRMMVTNYQTK